MTRRIKAAVLRPELWLGLLLLWITLSGLRSWHTPWARAAATETLRWAVGIGLALTLGFGLGSLQRAAKAVTLGLALLVCAIVAGGSHADGMVSGPYQDHQLCASALLVLLPFSAALALSARHSGWREGARFVGAAALACLALTGTRAAWAGAAVGGAVFAVCWLRRALPEGKRLPRVLLLSLLFGGAAIAFGIFLEGSGLGGRLATRAATLGALSRDGSWQWRLLAWRGAVDMIVRHPFVGWGVGHYPAAHWRFSPLSHPLGAAQKPTLSDEAHDLYLQTAVDIGLPGLALYLGALALAARRAWKALRPSVPPQAEWSVRDALLAASLSLLAGQGVDALASPAWQFAEVSLLFWLGLGLGLAALRGAEREEQPLPAPAQRFVQAGAAGGVAVFLTAQALPVGLLSPAEAYDQPSDWTLIHLTLTPAADTVVLPAHYGLPYQSLAYSMTAVYEAVDTQQTYTLTFTNTSDCVYSDMNGRSGFAGNVLTISKADDPTAPGQSTPYTIVGYLTDNSGVHAASTTLTITNA